MSASTTTLTRPSSDATLTRSPSDATLVVPIGGTGWGWALLARYGLFVSLSHFLSTIPVPYQWLGGPTTIIYRLQGRLAPLFTWVGDGDFEQLFAGWTAPLLLASLGTLIERVIPFLRARRPRYEPVVQEIARLFARYGLASFGASYGFEKVFGGQGAWAYEPRYFLSPYGDTGVWTTLMLWLGHSAVYEEFAGWVEISVALLLPFRRTTTLGSLIAFAALVNVCIVNTAFGGALATMTPLIFIPMAIFLLAPDLKRLMSFFAGRPTGPGAAAVLHQPRWLYRLGMGVKAVFVAWLILAHNHLYFSVFHAAESSLGGLYRVQRFTRNGAVEPVAYQFPRRWQDVAIGRVGEEIVVRTIDDTRIGYYTGVTDQPWMPDAENEEDRVLPILEQVQRTSLPKGEFKLTRREEGHPERSPAPTGAGTDFGTLRFTHRSPNEVTLSGVVESDTIEALLRKVPRDSLPFLAHRWYPQEWRRRIATWVRGMGFRYPY